MLNGIFNMFMLADLPSPGGVNVRCTCVHDHEHAGTMTFLGDDVTALQQEMRRVVHL